MRAEVVHDQVDGFGRGVGQSQMKQDLRELVAGSIRGGIGEMAARLGLYGTENVGGSATLVLAVLPGFPARGCRRRWPDIGMKCDGPLIQTNDWLLRIIGLFVRFQDVFHASDVFVGQFRNAPHFFPATAGGRGEATEFEWFLSPLVVPVAA